MEPTLDLNDKIYNVLMKMMNTTLLFQILIQVLIDHMEEQNVDGFTEAVKDYDSISRLDQWYTTILLRIKKQVNDSPDLRWMGVISCSVQWITAINFNYIRLQTIHALYLFMFFFSIFVY